MSNLSTEDSSRKQTERAPGAQAETMTPSRSLAVRIQRSIRRLAPGGVRNLQVHVDRDAIVLSGSCTTFYCKQIAQHAAMELSEGEQVINQIEVV